MLSQKRNPDDGDGPADGDNPDDKRRKFCFMRYYHMAIFSLSYFFLLGFCFIDFLWDCSCISGYGRFVVDYV